METASAWGTGSDDVEGYSFDPDIWFFDPMYFEAVVSWEYEAVETLKGEGNHEELEWLVRLLTICEPYPVEGLLPMDQAYPFSSEDIDSYVSFLIDPQRDIYEYDGEYYIGPEACYGFSDEDFICLDDEDPGLAVGLSPGLHRVLFP